MRPWPWNLCFETAPPGLRPSEREPAVLLTFDASTGYIQLIFVEYSRALLSVYHATSVPTHAPKPRAGDCQLRDSLIFKLYLVIFVSI